MTNNGHEGEVLACLAVVCDGWFLDAVAKDMKVSPADMSLAVMAWPYETPLRFDLRVRRPTPGEHASGRIKLDSIWYGVQIVVPGEDIFPACFLKGLVCENEPIIVEIRTEAHPEWHRPRLKPSKYDYGYIVRR